MYVGESGEGNKDKWYEYTHPGKDASDETMFEGIGDDIKFAMAKASFNFRNSIKEWMSEILQGFICRFIALHQYHSHVQPHHSCYPGSSCLWTQCV